MTKGAKEPAAFRFGRLYEREPNGCWLWLGAVNKQGYGTFNPERNKVYAHRWSYTFAKGEIPDGLELDHLCHNPTCVNPWHLEPVTKDENLARRRSAQLEFCEAGHPFSDANTYRPPTRPHRRVCRACVKRRQLSGPDTKKSTDAQVA